MKRHAILIAASPKSEPLPGVYTDISSWYAFLRSNQGGVWAEDEIVNVTDTGRSEIIAAISFAKNSDYAVVVFAGHGQTVKTELPWPGTQLLLSSGESILERELNPGTPRCTLVLDCCRTNQEQDQLGVLVKEASAALRDEDPVKHRLAFDQAVEAAEGGLVKVFSTALGTAAADKHSFSKHLIFRATEWAKGNKGVLSLRDVVSVASESIQQRNPQQKPEYNGGRRLRHFPFAVST
jgi:hypothetical protein